MTRRDLLALLASTAVVQWPGAGWGQQSERRGRMMMNREVMPAGGSAMNPPAPYPESLWITRC
jgi:hypothetical protein